MVWVSWLSSSLTELVETPNSLASSLRYDRVKGRVQIGRLGTLQALGRRPALHGAERAGQ
ncbi:MAG: hypothetical protein P8Y09_12515 [Deltaproteobacteria bacterium]